MELQIFRNCAIADDQRRCGSKVSSRVTDRRESNAVRERNFTDHEFLENDLRRITAVEKELSATFKN